MKHYYGYLPDKKDERDYIFKAVQKVEQLPVSIDLRLHCSKVRDQGDLGSCTGFALTALREYMEREIRTRWTGLARFLYNVGTLSPQFLYYEERFIEGTVNEDSGAEIRDGMKVLTNQGVCHESIDPYNINTFTKAPTNVALRNALTHKISVYSRLYTLNDIKSALVLHHGVVFGFYVYESFESDEVATTGVMPMPEAGEEILGGHAVFCCGYNDNTKRLIIKNSWGKEWGQYGYFFMPYQFVQPYNVADIWTASI